MFTLNILGPKFISLHTWLGEDMSMLPSPVMVKDGCACDGESVAAFCVVSAPSLANTEDLPSRGLVFLPTRNLILHEF